MTKRQQGTGTRPRYRAATRTWPAASPSDASAWITGATLDVAGGKIMV